MEQVSFDESIQHIFCNSHLGSNAKASVNTEGLSLIIVQCRLFFFMWAFASSWRTSFSRLLQFCGEGKRWQWLELQLYIPIFILVLTACSKFLVELYIVRRSKSHTWHMQNKAFKNYLKKQPKKKKKTTTTTLHFHGSCLLFVNSVLHLHHQN